VEFIKERAVTILAVSIFLVLISPLVLMVAGTAIEEAVTDFDAWRLCNNVTNKCTILPKTDWNRIGELRFEDKTNPENVKTFYHCTQDLIKLDRYR
jgi:hypothetical protein